MLVIPAAARMACWLNAWITGRASADAAISGIAAGDSTLGFRGVDVQSDHTPESDIAPAMLLGEVRRRHVSRASLALPYPGGPIGLGGPADFNAAAFDTRQAILLWGLDLGLVPLPGRTRSVWAARTAYAPTYLPDVAAAERALGECLISVADQLAALDVASWSPDAADALMNLRTSGTWDASMTFASPAAARLVTRGLRCTEIVRLALRDDGGALTAAQAAERRGVLNPLREASHLAVVAGCSSLDGR
jgi:hypothetical protein